MFTGKKVAVNIEQPKNCSKLQQDIITILVTILRERVTKDINYDHCHLAIPKGKIPLSYRNHRYDISMLIDGRVILIDVLNIDARYWYSKAGMNDGKG